MNNFIKVELKDKKIIIKNLLKDHNYFSEGDLSLMIMNNQSILNDKLDKLLEVKDEKLRTELPSPTRKEEEND